VPARGTGLPASPVGAAGEAGTPLGRGTVIMGDETVLSSAPVVCHEGSYLQVEVGGRQNGVVLDLTVKGSPELVRLEFRVKPEW
jgi:hypothetical protein